MAKLIIDGPDLVVGLSWLEKLGAFRGNVRVPLHAVRAAQADRTPGPRCAASSSPGTGIPGVIASAPATLSAAGTSPPCAGRGPPSGSTWTASPSSPGWSSRSATPRTRSPRSAAPPECESRA